MKRIASVVLALILLIALPVSAGAKTASFPDITDTDLMRDVAVLQMLGAVGGDDNGKFAPEGTLTRAAFCKMAVIVMGRGDAEPAYRNRTIFPDVRADYWARGYINLAVTGEKKLIQGGNDGLFRPDDPITAAQAVTILMRMLGYTDSDASMLWPEGYLSLASDIGLTDELQFQSPGAHMTRAQAARLFCNLLGTPVKNGSSYIGTLGTTVPDVVIMQLDVTATDRTSGAVRTSAGILKTANDILPPSILGLRGTILKNSTGKLLTFLPDRNTQTAVTVKDVESGWIIDASGFRYDISATAPAYTSEEMTTYGSAFVDISPGMRVMLFYGADGKVEGVYIGTEKTDIALVAGADGTLGTLSTLTGGDTGYTISKNGAPATTADIKPYDVVTYDRTARKLTISDFRLSGCYENCWPNMSSPVTMTLFGHDFNVLPSAVPSLSQFKVGQQITVLFTEDLQVAGAVTGNISGSTAIGIVQPGISASSASVKLLNGLVLSGDPSFTAERAAEFTGELVTVSSFAAGQISLSKVGGSSASGTLDVANKKFGGVSLNPAVKVFERVGTGPIVQISLSDLTQATVPASKILYARKDYAGRADLLILNDATGDRYTYGLLKAGTTTVYDGMFNVTYSTVSIVNSTNKTGTVPITTAYFFSGGSPGGLVASTDGGDIVSIVTLTSATGVKRSDFYTVNGVTYIMVNGTEFPVASNVECYNSLGKTWFDSLSDARAFSDNLTVCYDRPTSEGGKIRMVIAN